ncbi:MAG: hypothetical protein FK733_14100 [Asgard group archaeon]|nr:hypothetical protein [Asgard group archaeon]
MAEKDGMAFLNKKTLTTKYQEFIEKIADYLEKPKQKVKISVLIQKKESTDEIPKLGRKLGIVYDEKGNLTLAKWLYKLSEKERSSLVDYLIVRECFRHFFDQKIPTDQPYERFTEIVLQTVAVLWFCEEYNLTITNESIITIRRRIDGFEDENILQAQYWIYFLDNCHLLKLTAKQVFDVSVQRVQEAIKEEKPINDLAWDVMYWMKAHLPEEVSYALPLQLKKRHYELIKALSGLTFEDTSAVKMAEILNRSHNVVTRDYKQLWKNYKLRWLVKLDLLKLRLYPYFFRVNVKEKKHKEQIVEKLKTIRYVLWMRESELPNNITLVGWLESPLIVYEQIAEYFEKLHRSGIIVDYFINQIRKKRISWSITTKELEPTEETYETLIQKPELLNVFTINAINETYDIEQYKKKKQEYHKDIMKFISTLQSHHLGKAHFECRPLDLVYELCEESGVDTARTNDVIYFISQLAIRCRRMEIIDYYLHFREFATHKKALYIELEQPENMVLEKFIEKISFAGEITNLSFIDRVVLYFPDVKYDSVFREILDNLLKESNFQYKAFQINYYRGLRMPKFNYFNVFNFEKNQWIA